MRIIKKINNNVALARDAQGHDLVVFGRGVGFGDVPRELEDESALSRVFRDVDQGLLAAVSSISEDVLAASLDIVDIATREIDRELNSNLAFTLGDHLQFSLERLANGVQLDNPLALEVGYVYPKESEIAERALEVVRRHTGVKLPPAEASSIALHIVNAETGGPQDPANIALIMSSASTIEHVICVLERQLGMKIDRTSYSYIRFVTHLRYLIRRLSSDELIETSNIDMFEHIAASFPEAAEAARGVSAYLLASHGWRCSDEELLYLVMYINRLISTAREGA